MYQPEIFDVAESEPKKEGDRERRYPEGPRFFDWEKGLIWYRVGQNDSSNALPMSAEYSLANGCQVVRRDTGEVVKWPLRYSEATCGSLVYEVETVDESDFFGESTKREMRVETVVCDVIPGNSGDFFDT